MDFTDKRNLGTTLRDARVRWRRIPLSRYRRTVDAGVEVRAKRALEIPRVRVVVEELWEDPFVIEEWGWGPWKQRVCIGYWRAPGFDVEL